MAQQKAQIEYINVDDLKAYERNARTHSDEQIKQVAESIKEFGFTNPVLIDENNELIAGHGRTLAAKSIGMKEVPAIRLKGLTDAQKKALRIADNQLALNAGWDEELLRIELGELQDLDFNLDVMGFSDEELDLLLDGTGAIDDEEEHGQDAEEISEPPEDPVVKPGELWLLGDHQLLCGDSTRIDELVRLCEEGSVDLYLTDPPYNVAYEGKTKDALTIENDNMSDEDFRKFLLDAFSTADFAMKPGASFYIWHADNEGYNFRGACRDNAWKVRQCLVWNKNSLVLGRSDYQWKHEPCQPAGTMVRTPNGEVPIESLKDGDRVVSYDKYSGVLKGLRDGVPIQVASRPYQGTLYGVRIGDKQTWATDNHRFTVRLHDAKRKVYCVYLMRRGNWWRVGITETYNSRGFGLKQRMRQEFGEEAWILTTFSNRLDAQCAEQLVAVKFGIPYTHWEVERGFKDPKYETRSKEQIQWIYDNLDLDLLRQNAERALRAYGRRVEYPLITTETRSHHMSTRVTTDVRACNLIPEIMQLPVPYAKYEGVKTFSWQAIDAVETKEHDGPVYSLQVEKYEHYIADGIVTHNCLYGWKDGAGHAWYSDRKQTTVLDFDKPLRNGDHPTMKPVDLFEYQIGNSTKKGDIVLDSFAGSGTTVIACENTGRKARAMELDPRYCDVIIKRWQDLTGEDAVREDGVTFNNCK